MLESDERRRVDFLSHGTRPYFDMGPWHREGSWLALWDKVHSK
jgi:hypothetical protein